MYKKGEELYIADLDRNKVNKGLYQQTHREEMEQHSTFPLDEKTKEVLNHVYWVEIPNEETLCIQKEIVFKTYQEAEEKLSEMKLEFEKKLSQNDGWIKEILKPYYNMTSINTKEYILELLKENKEKLVIEYIIPWFEENHESEAFTTIMETFLLEKFDIEIKQYM